MIHTGSSTGSGGSHQPQARAAVRWVNDAAGLITGCQARRSSRKPSPPRRCRPRATGVHSTPGRRPRLVSRRAGVTSRGCSSFGAGRWFTSRSCPDGGDPRTTRRQPVDQPAQNMTCGRLMARSRPRPPPGHRRAAGKQMGWATWSAHRPHPSHPFPVGRETDGFVDLVSSPEAPNPSVFHQAAHQTANRGPTGPQTAPAPPGSSANTTGRSPGWPSMSTAAWAITERTWARSRSAPLWHGMSTSWIAGAGDSVAG
jgi:hypothetical protein